MWDSGRKHGGDTGRRSRPDTQGGRSRACSRTLSPMSDSTKRPKKKKRHLLRAVALSTGTLILG
ncbi:MAG: hypothetical protein K8H88_15220, partial [Sandaracinaceae bacterium]|nr:hypothetical protein [Sandaracinaceae bacterium]